MLPRGADVCDRIAQIERLADVAVVALVLAEGPDELAFVLPGGSDDAYVRLVLGRVAAACQDALKSR